MQMGTAKAIANVDHEAGEITISADEKTILGIIKAVLKIPSMIRERLEGRVRKRKAATVEEHIFHAIRNRIHSPYWVGPKNMTLELPKYQEKMGILEIEALLVK
jgi:hypothetical protein